MSDGIESIFEKIPVDEGQKNEQTSGRDMGDRVAKGDTNSRIEAFGDMLEDDDYGAKPKAYEPVKIEKDKLPDSTKGSGEEKEEAPEEEEVLDEPSDGEEEKEEVEETQEELLKKLKDTKIKVKVDGQFEEKTLEELKAAYSHRAVLDRKMNEVSKERATFVKEKEQMISDQKYMQGEVQELREGFAVSINEYMKNGFNTKNPLGALDTLLDKLGIDSYAFNRAAFEYNLPEYEKFFEMGDIERDAYFMKKENDFYKKRDTSLADRTREAHSRTERQAQEFNLIKSSGLSIDQFNEHFDELEALGDDQLSVERVLEFAKVKPIYDRAGGIVSKTSKAGDIALIQQVSALLMEFPNTEESEIIEHIDGKARAKKAQEILKDKENFTVKRGNKKSSNNDAYFTEEELIEFNEIRRH